MLQEEAIEVVRNFDLLVDYEDAIIFVVDYIENNDHILNCALDSIGLDEMKTAFSMLILSERANPSSAARKKNLPLLWTLPISAF